MATEHNVNIIAKLDTSQVRQQLNQLNNGRTNVNVSSNNSSNRISNDRQVQSLTKQLTQLRSSIDNLTKEIRRISGSPNSNYGNYGNGAGNIIASRGIQEYLKNAGMMNNRGQFTGQSLSRYEMKNVVRPQAYAKKINPGLFSEGFRSGFEYYEDKLMKSMGMNPNTANYSQSMNGNVQNKNNNRNRARTGMMRWMSSMVIGDIGQQAINVMDEGPAKDYSQIGLNSVTTGLVASSLATGPAGMILGLITAFSTAAIGMIGRMKEMEEQFNKNNVAIQKFGKMVADIEEEEKYSGEYGYELSREERMMVDINKLPQMKKNLEKRIAEAREDQKEAKGKVYEYYNSKLSEKDKAIGMKAYMDDYNNARKEEARLNRLLEIVKQRQDDLWKEQQDMEYIQNGAHTEWMKNVKEEQDKLSKEKGNYLRPQYDSIETMRVLEGIQNRKTDNVSLLSQYGDQKIASYSRMQQILKAIEKETNAENIQDLKQEYNEQNQKLSQANQILNALSQQSIDMNLNRASLENLTSLQSKGGWMGENNNTIDMNRYVENIARGVQKIEQQMDQSQYSLWQ